MDMAEDDSPGHALSRRHVLTAAVGVSAALAVGGVAGSASSSAADVTDGGHGDGTEAGGPIVVHLRDLASGSMDVFSGTERRQISDPALAVRIARAANSPASASL
jgi:hypothetical protein